MNWFLSKKTGGVPNLVPDLGQLSKFVRTVAQNYGPLLIHDLPSNSHEFGVEIITCETRLGRKGCFQIDVGMSTSNHRTPVWGTSESRTCFGLDFDPTSIILSCHRNWEFVGQVSSFCQGPSNPTCLPNFGRLYCNRLSTAHRRLRTCEVLAKVCRHQPEKSYQK